jgi:O-antigen/teichoic acid export membrane protein
VYLGPAGVGVIGTIDQFVQLVAYASSLSLPAASIKFLSKSHSAGQREFERSYAGFFKLLLLLSIGAAVLTTAAVLFKSDLLGAEIEKYRLVLILGLLTLPVFNLTTLFINVFAAAQKFKASSLLVVIINATTMGATITGIMIDGMFGLYLSNLFAGIMLAGCVMIYFREKLRLPLYDTQTNIWAEFKQSPEISLLAMMLYFGAIAALLAYLVARYSVLKNFGETEAGLLHGVIAVSLALGMALNPAINLYLTPLVNRNVERSVKIRETIQFQRKMALILSLAALPILMFPQLTLTIMFSTKFAAVSQLVFLFVMSQFLLQLAGAYQALLISLDDVKIYTVIVTLGQLLFALVSFLSVSYFGIKGVAFGLFLGNSFIFSLNLIRLIAKHDFFIPLNLGLLLVYSFSVLLLTGWLCSQFAELDITNTLYKIVFFIIFGGSLFLFLNKEEKAYLGILREKFFWRK